MLNPLSAPPSTFLPRVLPPPALRTSLVLLIDQSFIRTAGLSLLTTLGAIDDD